MTENNKTAHAAPMISVPTIICCNHATVPLGIDFQKLIGVLQTYVTKYVLPVWNTGAMLVASKRLHASSWGIVFLDSADQLGASGFHQLTPAGLPLAKVFVKTALEEEQPISVAASHELVEMLVDPSNSITTAGPKAGVRYAYESADPVEDCRFVIDGVEVTNFVYPEYFEAFHKPKSVQFDYMRRVDKPFQILKGGYQSIIKDGVQSNLFGSVAKERSFQREDRRGHRVESRNNTARSDPNLIAKYFG